MTAFIFRAQRRSSLPLTNIPSTMACPHHLLERQQVPSTSAASRRHVDVRLKTLMYDAFTDAPGRRLALRSLYKELERRHPELKERKTDWKGTVRHLLCSLPDFNQDKKCKVRGVWMMKEKAHPQAPLSTIALEEYMNIVSFAKSDIQSAQTDSSPISIAHSAFDSPTFGSPSSAFFDSQSVVSTYPQQIEWQAALEKENAVGIDQLSSLDNGQCNVSNNFKNVDLFPYFNHVVFDQFRDTF